MWTVEWFAIVLFVLGPLAAGAAAVDAARLTRPGSVHLVVTVPNGWRSYVRAAGWCATPLVVVHVLAIGCGLAYGEVSEPSVGWPALLAQVALQALAIVWFVAVGSALGRLLNPLFAGLVGSVAGFVLTYLLGDGGGSGHFALLGLGSATLSRLGLSYHSPYLLSQGFLLGCTAVLLVLVPTRGGRGLRLPSGRGTAALCAALGLIVVGQLLLPERRLEAAPRAPEMCSDEGVRVCLFQEHRQSADHVRRQVRVLVAAARANGYDSLVPEEVVESSRTFAAARPGTATFALPLSTGHPDRERLDDWAYELTTPTHCPVLSSGQPPADSYLRRKALLEVTWLSLVGIRSDLLDFGEGLHVLTPAQVARIVADFRACRLG